ncbi:hypothetical protein AJ79_05176 [Helicocarpus griseus UAMH5409]|uniref:FAD-binding domain-containing protein n=1 Tax=Helicocarpus griseus UAMH5409 TaxID=1447875 RepID=A0A2B7XPR8_9EURO|nr:hypothetical protein AJ79_05176 [Helicocarpus griseus UAMH5409]
MTFLDRQLALGVLYDHLTDKSKVLTKKGLKKVEIEDNGVRVTTEDGELFTGDILVGADGVHSKVRQEMLRLSEPGHFPPETKAMPCDYGCIFGISNPCGNIKAGSYNGVFHHNRSYLILGALHDRVFWFHFFKLEKRTYGTDIPRFSKEDEAQQLKKVASDPVMPGFTFGDIVQNKITSNMTAVPEYTYNKWHYDRIITTGDACHKFHPITGHGGNAAIETAATLTNGLVKAFNKSTSSTLSSPQISSLFQEVQDIRYKRVKDLIQVSHDQQRVEALEILSSSL